MKIQYIDDKKEKRQSHEIHAKTFESCCDGNMDLSISAYGATKEEAETNAKAQMKMAIRSLTSAIESLENS
jgi:hypothetical protein